MISANITERGYGLTIDGLQKLPPRVLAAAALGLDRGLQAVVSLSQLEYLQGPRPIRLGEITGRLRNSINREVKQTGDTVTGRVGSNVAYAAFHEFGFHGTEHVRSFNRVIGNTSVGGAGPVVLGGGKKTSQKMRQGAALFETVRAHDRKIDYVGRPFVFPALQRSLPIILQEITTQLAKISG